MLRYTILNKKDMDWHVGSTLVKSAISSMERHFSTEPIIYDVAIPRSSISQQSAKS